VHTFRKVWIFSILIRTHASQTDFVVRLLLRLMMDIPAKHTCRAFTARELPQFYKTLAA
jgi:hypothetical protein